MTRQLSWMDQAQQDARFGLRLIRRNPGFALVVVLTLALGIGATTAVFSVVNAVLIRPLPYPHADRLVWLTRYNTMLKAEVVPGVDYLDWREMAKSFDEMVAYTYYQETLAAADSAEPHWFAGVTEGFWSLSGARVAAGRLFGARDRETLVLSDGLFERRFKRDASVIGKIVSVGGRPVTIIGVLPKGFRFALPRPIHSMWRRVRSSSDVEGYLLNPISPGSEVRGGPMTIQLVAARLKPGVQRVSAETELQGIQARISTASSGPSRAWLAPRVMLLQDRLVRDVRNALQILLGAVSLVFLIACANAAALLVARASARQREVAIRIAIGADRWRVVRQFASENLALGCAGGAAGLLLAHWMVLSFVNMAPQAVPRLGEADIDWRVVLFASGISLGAVVLSGVGAVWGAWRHPMFDGLRGSAGPAVTGLLFRRTLVAGEVALAILLLTGAGLLLKSFWRLNTHPAGFDPAHTLMLQVALNGPGYDNSTHQRAYFQEMLSQLGALPGVQAVSFVSTVARGPIQRVGEAKGPSGQAPIGSYHAVSAAFGSVLGLRLNKGRWLTEQEPGRVALINGSYARTMFGATDPIGQRIMVEGLAPPPNMVPATVVGVVDDLNYTRLGASPEPEIYVPYLQTVRLKNASLLVRTMGSASPVAQAVRTAAASIDRSQPPGELESLDQSLAESVLPQRFNLSLLGAFAAVSLVLALVGIHGVIAYSVRTRTQEIGIRVALGASGGDVVRLIIAQGMTAVVTGIAAGLALAFGLTRFMASLLFEVRPFDPLTFGFVALLLALTAFTACWFPARKAARVEPLVALRHD